jgi:hypothetical protein
MQRPRQFIVFLIALTLQVLGGVGGICASRGMCAYLFGSAKTDEVLQHHQFGHPAWWVFLFAALVGLIVGWFGVLFVIVIPLSAAYKLSGTFDDKQSRRFLIGYANVLRRLARVERAAKRPAG